MIDLERAATFRDRLEKAGLQPVPWQGHMAVIAGSYVEIFLVGQLLPGIKAPTIAMVTSDHCNRPIASFVCYWDQVPYVGSWEERNQE